MPSHTATVDGVPTDPIPTVGAAKLLLYRVAVQNVDATADLYIWEGYTPPTDPAGHRIQPGQWYDATIGYGLRLWVWTTAAACSLVVTYRPTVSP